MIVDMDINSMYMDNHFNTSGVKIWEQSRLFDSKMLRYPNRKEKRKLNLDVVHLHPGEELCGKCRGTGTLVYCTKKRFDKDCCIPCNECYGKGKYDWLDVIMNRHKGTLIDTIA